MRQRSDHATTAIAPFATRMPLNLRDTLTRGARVKYGDRYGAVARFVVEVLRAGLPHVLTADDFKAICGDKVDIDEQQLELFGAAVEFATPTRAEEVRVGRLAAKITEAAARPPEVVNGRGPSVGGRSLTPNRHARKLRELELERQRAAAGRKRPTQAKRKRTSSSTRKTRKR